MAANDGCFFLHMPTWNELARTTSTPASVLMLHLWVECKNGGPVRCTKKDAARFLNCSDRTGWRALKELSEQYWIEPHSRSHWTLRAMPTAQPGDIVNGQPWDGKK